MKNHIKNNTRSFCIFLLFILGLVLSLIINGALPFYGIPTLGQAIWTTGFSLSFLNDSLFSIYAINFGQPKDAAIAFGLSGAWPTAVLINFGLHPADAYASMVALWLSIAFWAAYKTSILCGLSKSLSILSSITWCSFPIIWGHSGYSMLSIGIALLPWYFLTAFNLFNVFNTYDTNQKTINLSRSITYLFVCIVSVFMDGYSFMMFAVGSTIIGLWQLIEKPQMKPLIFRSLFIHLVSFTVAYGLYVLYVGKFDFEPSSLDFFRGWGADISFFLIPSTGMHLVPDLLGLSIPRTEQHFFGDASVWITTFSLPLILSAILMLIIGLKNIFLRKPLIIIAVLAFYMALGPSLKFNSQKPEGMVQRTMPSEFAIMPTGSGFISNYLPGFKSMRASYRWTSLGVWALWMLVVLSLSNKSSRSHLVIGASALILITTLNIPDLSKKIAEYKHNRVSFMQIDNHLVDDMRDLIHQREKVVFLPWRNDFLVNYLASRLDIYTYNIGGDKNLMEARRHWPETMLRFPMARTHENFFSDILAVLVNGDTDVIVLPYIDMLWAAHRWPYPISLKNELIPWIDKFKASSFLLVEERDYYSTIRLSTELKEMQSVDRLLYLKSEICFSPYCLERLSFRESTLTQVGQLINYQLVSDGRAGFLHFGPYLPIMPGTYLLEVYGYGSGSGDSWVDVVSNQGKIIHFKQKISFSNVDENILLSAEVNIDENLNDLEIRIFNNVNDHITLLGYRMSLIND